MSPNDPLKKRSRAMAISIGSFLLAAILIFFYWLLYARFVVYTDDAYINGNQVIVSPQVRGIITCITTDNTQLVEQGALLFTLDPTEASIQLQKTKDELADTIRNVVQMFEAVKQYEATLIANKAEIVKTQQDFDHRQALISQSAVSIEDMEHAEAYLSIAKAHYEETYTKWVAAVARVENTTIATHPIVEKAKDELRAAFLAYARCEIYAPATGIIAQRSGQVGAWVNPGDALLAIIPLDQIWVDANYKETQLKKLRIGQKVSIHADMYGSEVEFHGKVQGQNAGTGSVFSVLPPQNATGNWIKIVQRVPVRIWLDPEEIIAHPLWLGLSIESRINIRDQTGEFISKSKPLKPLYQTDVFSNQLNGCEELIQNIISQNLPSS